MASMGLRPWPNFAIPSRCFGRSPFPRGDLADAGEVRLPRTESRVLTVPRRSGVAAGPDVEEQSGDGAEIVRQRAAMLDVQPTYVSLLDVDLTHHAGLAVLEDVAVVHPLPRLVEARDNTHLRLCADHDGVLVH